YPSSVFGRPRRGDGGAQRCGRVAAARATDLLAAVDFVAVCAGRAAVVGVVLLGGDAVCGIVASVAGGAESICDHAFGPAVSGSVAGPRDAVSVGGGGAERLGGAPQPRLHLRLVPELGAA